MAAMEEIKESQSNRDNQGSASHILTPKGARFALGNQVSRGNKNVRIDTETLLETLKEVEKEKKKPIMKHIWEVAYRDNKFLAKVIDKFIANKGIDISNLTGGGQYVVNIQYFGDRKPTDPTTESAKTIDIQGIDDDKGR
jgi:hypothetical protein